MVFVRKGGDDVINAQQTLPKGRMTCNTCILHREVTLMLLPASCRVRARSSLCIDEDAVADFLHQNGFIKVDSRDATGWSPLCCLASGCFWIASWELTYSPPIQVLLSRWFSDLPLWWVPCDRSWPPPLDLVDSPSNWSGLIFCELQVVSCELWEEHFF